MAKWNFFVSNTSLIKELDTSGNDVNPQSQSFLAPTLDLQGDKIVFKESGVYKTTLLFTEIGEIDGVNPSDLQDAYDKIIAIIPNSGGGGGSTPDATTTVKGKLKLAGDLSGTADLPTVPGLANKQNTLTETNFGSFVNSLTAKNTLVDADEVVSDDSEDSNKAKKTTWLNVWLNYFKQKADALYAVPNITITTSISIDTDTTGSGYGQHGRNTKISNGANAINLTVQTSSNADFIASYTKIGSATITFVAGSGTTLVQLSGTAILNGAVGSTACLTRNGNVYYLQITNY